MTVVLFKPIFWGSCYLAVLLRGLGRPLLFWRCASLSLLMHSFLWTPWLQDVFPDKCWACISCLLPPGVSLSLSSCLSLIYTLSLLLNVVSLCLFHNLILSLSFSISLCSISLFITPSLFNVRVWWAGEGECEGRPVSQGTEGSRETGPCTSGRCQTNCGAPLPGPSFQWNPPCVTY